MASPLTRLREFEASFSKQLSWKPWGGAKDEGSTALPTPEASAPNAKEAECTPAGSPSQRRQQLATSPYTPSPPQFTRQPNPVDLAYLKKSNAAVVGEWSESESESEEPASVLRRKRRSRQASPDTRAPKEASSAAAFPAEMILPCPFAAPWEPAKEVGTAACGAAATFQPVLTRTPASVRPADVLPCAAPATARAATTREDAPPISAPLLDAAPGVSPPVSSGRRSRGGGFSGGGGVSGSTGGTGGANGGISGSNGVPRFGFSSTLAPPESLGRSLTTGSTRGRAWSFLSSLSRASSLSALQDDEPAADATPVSTPAAASAAAAARAPQRLTPFERAALERAVLEDMVLELLVALPTPMRLYLEAGAALCPELALATATAAAACAAGPAMISTSSRQLPAAAGSATTNFLAAWVRASDYDSSRALRRVLRALTPQRVALGQPLSLQARDVTDALLTGAYKLLPRRDGRGRRILLVHTRRIDHERCPPLQYARCLTYLLQIAAEDDRVAAAAAATANGAAGGGGGNDGWCGGIFVIVDASKESGAAKVRALIDALSEDVGADMPSAAPTPITPATLPPLTSPLLPSQAASPAAVAAAAAAGGGSAISGVAYADPQVCHLPLIVHKIVVVYAGAMVRAGLLARRASAATGGGGGDVHGGGGSSTILLGGGSTGGGGLLKPRGSGSGARRPVPAATPAVAALGAPSRADWVKELGGEDGLDLVPDALGGRLPGFPWEAWIGYRIQREDVQREARATNSRFAAGMLGFLDAAQALRTACDPDQYRATVAALAGGSGSHEEVTAGRGAGGSSGGSGHLDVAGSNSSAAAGLDEAGLSLAVPVAWVKRALGDVVEARSVHEAVPWEGGSVKTEVQQLWKDMQRDTVDVDGVVIGATDAGEPGAVMAVLAARIAAVAGSTGGSGSAAGVAAGASKNCAFSTFSGFGGGYGSNNGGSAVGAPRGVQLSEVDCFLAARDVLLATKRTTSGGDVWLCVDRLCRSDARLCGSDARMVVVCPLSNQADPLHIRVELAADADGNNGSGGGFGGRQQPPLSPLPGGVGGGVGEDLHSLAAGRSTVDPASPSSFQRRRWTLNARASARQMLRQSGSPKPIVDTAPSSGGSILRIAITATETLSPGGSSRAGSGSGRAGSGSGRAGSGSGRDGGDGPLSRQAAREGQLRCWDSSGGGGSGDAGWLGKGLNKAVAKARRSYKGARKLAAAAAGATRLGGCTAGSGSTSSHNVKARHTNFLSHGISPTRRGLSKLRLQRSGGETGGTTAGSVNAAEAAVATAAPPLPVVITCVTRMCYKVCEADPMSEAESVLALVDGVYERTFVVRGNGFATTGLHPTEDNPIVRITARVPKPTPAHSGRDSAAAFSLGASGEVRAPLPGSD